MNSDRQPPLSPPTTPPLELKRRPRFMFVIPTGLALVYGLVSWFFFTSDLTDIHQIVSWSYLLGMPFTVGGLTTFLGIKLYGRSNFWIYLAPLLTVTLGIILSYITRLEALLCVVVAAPVMLTPAVLSGIIVGALMRRMNDKLHLNMLVLLPFATPFVEDLWEQPHELVTITDQVVIHADAEVIWEHIASVAPISEEELPSQWIYHLDFPKPISAEIDRHAVGGIRRATFEREVTFFEQVTVWEPGEQLSFSIHADPEFIPKSAFDQHIIVGGRFYDVLDGTYRIEQRDDHCILHLASNHRLSSPFNQYSGIWSKWVMNQIQGSILTVIQQRCETEQKAQDSDLQ